MFRGHSPSGPGRAQNQAFWVAFPASVFIWFVEALSEYFVKHSWIKGVWQASEDFIIVWLGHCLKREKCFRVQSPRSILVVDETAADSFPLFLVGGDAVQNGISYLRVQNPDVCWGPNACFSVMYTREVLTLIVDCVLTERRGFRSATCDLHEDVSHMLFQKGILWAIVDPESD